MEPIVIPGQEKRETKWKHLAPYLRQSGSHSLAYSNLQERINCFLVPGAGFLGFSEIDQVPSDRPADDMAVHFRSSLVALLDSQGFKSSEAPPKNVHVFSDPVCTPDKRSELIGEFLKIHPNPCFWQTSEAVSSVLQNFGFYTNHFGFETVLDLKDYHVSGNAKQNLKFARNKARNLGYELTELDSQSVNWDELKQISEEWIKGKISNRDELTFLARPMELRPEEDVRIFGGFKDKKLEGYVIFSPIYKEGKVTGYLKDIIRTTNNAFEEFQSRSLSNALTVDAINKFREEGKEELSLGLSPFYGIEDTNHTSNPAASLMFAGIFQSANSLYGFERLARSKEIYRGRKERVYFNSKEPSPIDQTVDLFRLCKVFT